MTSYKSKNRHKYLLQYHLILVCKYRKKLFLNKHISHTIKILSNEICKRYNVTINHMETDKDHIHYMLEIPLEISISKVVKLAKSYTTYHIWKKYNTDLEKKFWKEKTLKEYIENQG